MSTVLSLLTEMAAKTMKIRPELYELESFFKLINHELYLIAKQERKYKTVMQNHGLCSTFFVSNGNIFVIILPSTTCMSTTVW